MTPPDPDGLAARRPAREEEALAEIGATRVRPRVAVLGIAIFLVLLAAGPTLEPFVQLPKSGLDRPEFDRVLPARAEIRRAWNRTGWSGLLEIALETIDRAESRVDRYGALARLLRGPTQGALFETLAHGNAEVVVGRDDWLFLRDAVEHTTGPGILSVPSGAVDPASGLVQFQRELDRRGIRLLVLPVPEKEQIHPELLVSAAPAPPVRNRDFQELVERLRAAGVAVFDPAPLLVELASRGAPVYMATDTHWTPTAVDRVAERLAELLRSEHELPPAAAGGFPRQPVRLTFDGDLARLLGLPSGSRLPAERVDTLRVYRGAGEGFDASAATSPVLLLGDSFSLMFSRQGDRLQSAGLADQLTHYLGFPVRLMGDVRANSLARRIRWLGPRFSRIPGTRVLIYEFAVRDLSIQEWTASREGLPKYGGRPLTSRKPGR